MNGKTIELQYPIKSGGKEMKQLVMRRPKVRDVRINEEQSKGVSDAEREVRLFASLCDVTPDMIDDLDMSDYGQLQGAYKGFLLPAGEKSGSPS